MSNEEKAQNFLNYVARNEKRLKYNLAKNITYNSEIFDDVYSETILKIYNSIKKNGTEIKDIEHYFYISSKWVYVLFDNRQKKKQQREERNYFDCERNDIIDEDYSDSEERFNKTIHALNRIKAILSDYFSTDDINVFFDYFNGKANEKSSYRRMAEQRNVNPSEIAKTIKKVKRYIEKNEEIQQLKKLVYD